MFENPNLQPPDNKEVKYTECDVCRGHGIIGVPYIDEDNFMQVESEKCPNPNCDNGQIEIED